jgi:urease accessory protein
MTSESRWIARRCPWIGRLLFWSATAALWPTPALAHGSLAVGDFYTGMFHPLLHFETLLPTLALALWSGQQGRPHAWRLPLLFLTAVLLGAGTGILGIELGGGRPLLLLSMPILGLLVATRRRLPDPAALAMVALFGFTLGQVGTADPGGRLERPLLFVLGVGSSVGLILYHVATRVLRHRAFWVQTGARVLGSWIAAAGLLVSALEWAGR